MLDYCKLDLDGSFGEEATRPGMTELAAQSRRVVDAVLLIRVWIAAGQSAQTWVSHHATARLQSPPAETRGTGQGPLRHSFHH
jgi:hypothetical protein